MSHEIRATPTASAAGFTSQQVADQRLRICSFESRRAAEMRSLIERQGGIATIAPSMREIPLVDNPRVFEFAEELLAGRIEVVIFLTGVGTRALVEAWLTRYDFEAFLQALDRCTVVVRGPKPTAVLREWNVRIDLRAPEPNTWRELLDVIDANLSPAGKNIAVQEYGRPNEELYRALEQRGASVLSVPVYRWALPEDVEPLLAAVRATIAGQFDVLMITSANQVTNVLTVAESDGLREAWLEAARKCVIASIGPAASETLIEAGLPPDVEASPPKMGQLVRQAIETASAKLGRKKSNPA
ncbi:MAG: uroporphyrinogen-III synthase [Planctomycetaceae bacterium]